MYRPAARWSTDAGPAQARTSGIATTSADKAYINSESRPHETVSSAAGFVMRLGNRFSPASSLANFDYFLLVVFLAAGFLAGAFFSDFLAATGFLAAGFFVAAGFLAVAMFRSPPKRAS